jgi:hypothetical protein
MTEERGRSKYADMTTNERLFEAGTLKAFDAAARRRDRASMIQFLEQVDFISEDAQQSVDTILAHSAKYGF